MDIHIITGHLGSGKTEIAVNFALRLAARAKHANSSAAVALVDIDVINPYFAAREARNILESQGIQVAAPSIHTTTAALPVLPKEVYQMLHREDYTLVLDVGGDSAGARILGSLCGHLRGKPLHVYCVVNTKRPFTRDYHGILEYLTSIGAASRLAFTGLIHNTHLLHETSVEDICAGQELLEQAARETGVPLVLTAAMKNLAKDLEGRIANDVLLMEQYIKPPYGM
ncbi:hypothetical protein U27_06928 [Candidatus Vecturithrix granuli]|uniref:CobQ/CobB/MinD/ParA nucleotide binding domain-containing protein n=1 Tax=Vecturithrix granuli TaxID=1499967 RepID=A0A081C5T7_VECG1|nr:hypothetical protein U27_06928 [Candidatus Vecturithrix granuli]